MVGESKWDNTSLSGTRFGSLVVGVMCFVVLNVASPFTPVGPDAVGGAEQVLTQLDIALTRAGHDSIVMACEGSTVQGIHISMPRPAGSLNEAVRAQVYQQYREAMGIFFRKWRVDVVHFHGPDFPHYLPPVDVPALATLHLPPDCYPPEIFQLERPRTFIHCVSSRQRDACPPCGSMLPEIESGISGECFGGNHSKRRFAVALGRICPEMGFHSALDAARRAKTPLLLAGEVFGYQAHESYFQSEITPRLDSTRRFLGAIGLRRKRRLLGAARCLLAPSRLPETSAIVAMESLASGTPVIAFPAGALADIVEHGKTGFLVRDEDEMAEAIQAADTIDPRACREAARKRFSIERMIESYFSLYECLTCYPQALGARREISDAAGLGLA